MRFRLVPMVDDLGWPWTVASSNFLVFLVISQIWEATTAKRMKIDPYCQWQICSPNYFSDIPYRSWYCWPFFRFGLQWSYSQRKRHFQPLYTRISRKR